MKSRGLGDVYKRQHVGNARSTVAFDTIRRYFEYRGYEVAYISNFTDVDDKIINRAKEEGITPQEVADKYIAAFREDVTALGVKPATRHPRVVEFMADIIRFVEDLIEKGFAYESQGDVYFLSLIHISEPTRLHKVSRMPSSA